MDSLWLSRGVALLGRLIGGTRLCAAAILVARRASCERVAFLRRWLLRASGVLRVCSGGGSGGRTDLAAVLQLVLPVDDNHVAAVDAGGEADAVAAGLRYGDVLDFRGVPVLHDVDV